MAKSQFNKEFKPCTCWSAWPTPQLFLENISVHCFDRARKKGNDTVAFQFIYLVQFAPTKMLQVDNKVVAHCYAFGWAIRHLRCNFFRGFDSFSSSSTPDMPQIVMSSARVDTTFEGVTVSHI